MKNDREHATIAASVAQSNLPGELTVGPRYGTPRSRRSLGPWPLERKFHREERASPMGVRES